MNQSTQPPAERTMSEATALRLRKQITDAIVQPRTRRRIPRKAFWVTGLTSTIVIGTSTAWAYQQFDEATITSEVRCYSMPDLGDGDHYPGLTTTSPDMMSGESMTFEAAIDACTVSWTAGVLVEGDPRIHEPTNGGSAPVPGLTACVVAGGIAGVFPGGPGTCADLGLSQLTP